MWLQGITQVHALIIVIIKVVIKHKILSIDTVLSAYTHTHTHIQRHTDYTKLNLYNLKQAAKRNLSHMKTAMFSGSQLAACFRLTQHRRYPLTVKRRQAGHPAWEWTLT